MPGPTVTVRMKELPALGAALLLGGCIVVPRATEVYDPQCRTMVRQVVLETAVIGSIAHCHNEGCAAMLASLGIVTAASAVVSGSVALIGNMVYWAERRGQCPPQATDAPAPASAAPAAAAAAASGVRPRPPVVPGLIPFPPAPKEAP
jgi:hypothetical protein